LALPEGTPVIMHVWQGIVYDYGSYTVEVRFLSDGSVDVIYNSGLLRRIAFPPDYSTPQTNGVPVAPPSTLPPPRRLE
jgi:hypothetical protein